MRVLGLDVGFNFGHGLVQYGGPVFAGTRRVHGDMEYFGRATSFVRDHVDGLLTKFKPDLVMVAEPFIRRHPVPTATSLRPLFGFEAVIEMVCFDRGVEVREENESRVRGYFMPGTPHKSEIIKAAAVEFCRARTWPCDTNHAADALLMAAYGLVTRVPERAHELLPMFHVKHPQAAA